VVGSLLLSVLLLGYKLSAVRKLFSTMQRRKELRANLALLQPKLEAEALAVWLRDIEHDVSQRNARIAAMTSASGLFEEEALEAEAIKQASDAFASLSSETPMQRSSSAAWLQLPPKATLMRSETKHDQVTGRLLGRAEAEIRATPEEIAMYALNFDSRHVMSGHRAGLDIRSETLQDINAHHTVIFNRKRATGARDRTFLNSIVAKRVQDHPQIYIVAVVPIPSHEKIRPSDEAGAIRAENWRYSVSVKVPRTSLSVGTLQFPSHFAGTSV
jgi:hypothetical protein